MLIGFFSYNLTNASIQSFFKKGTDEITLESSKDEIKEGLEKYMLTHNLQRDVKQLSMKVLNSWKDTIDIRFKYNYNDITKSPLFLDMYPSLQNKVL